MHPVKSRHLSSGVYADAYVDLIPLLYAKSQTARVVCWHVWRASLAAKPMRSGTSSSSFSRAQWTSSPDTGREQKGEKRSSGWLVICCLDGSLDLGGILLSLG